MKRSLSLLIVLILMILNSCKKNNNNGNDVIDSWKLIEVYDKNTNTTSLPVTSGTDVVLTFLSGNRFAGHTLKNTFTDGTYTQNGNNITFGTFTMTKVAEDTWGGSFLTVLSACLLQSTSPCAPSKISIQGRIMKIVSPMRYDITLEKL